MVDLGHIVHNLAQARRLAPESAVCAVVKADAYGHGLVPVARALERAGAHCFGVALIEEGLALRAAGIARPILVWGASYAGGYAAVVAAGLTPVLSDAAQLAPMAEAAAAANRVLDVHLEVDTGMARLGVPLAAAPAFARACAAQPSLRLAGLMSHLARADADGDPFSVAQLQRFAAAAQDLAQAGLAVPLAHIGNSPALVSLPAARLGLVRCGLMLYGLDPMLSRRFSGLLPALRLVSAVVGLRRIAAGTPVSYGGRWVAGRDSVIGTLALGYGDGYPRLLGNRGAALVRGQRAPVIGAVCMDLCMVDLTDIAGAAVGDEAVLIGAQGGEHIGAEAVAGWADTISYEVLCGIGARVPRQYV